MTPDPKDISIKDYTYDLPHEKIAQFPLEERDRSKLLIYDGKIKEDIFSNIDNYIQPDGLLIFNDTKVIRARILFPVNDLKFVEVFCLEPEGTSDLNTALNSKGKARWKCMIGGLKKWKERTIKKEFEVYSQMCSLEAELIKGRSDPWIVEFKWTPGDIPFSDILNFAGLIPLPPYIKRDTVEEDSLRYQTVYSLNEGSVAAPTAGLHFTEAILKKLEERNISIDHLTLHVGAGTFKPVKAEKLGEHEMHRELFSVTKQVIEDLLNNTRNVTCVGTTSLRTIESLYWIGLKLKNDPLMKGIHLGQWEPYILEPELKLNEALSEILSYLDREGTDTLTGYTEVIIVPGYKFKIVNSLVTNFHQPQSTLLLLIAAFAGSSWKDIYDHALAQNFRFLSYGDSSLIFRQGS